MNNNLRSDQYTHVSQDCPMRVDVHPADDVVEVVLGEYRFGDDTLRLVIDHPDTVRRLATTFHDACVELVEHLRVKATTDPAITQLGALPNWPR